ncbi:MAG: arylsulfatase A-like enzyme, partial [Candidatus Paceibacteria bacterium]
LTLSPGETLDWTIPETAGESLVLTYRPRWEFITEFQGTLEAVVSVDGIAMDTQALAVPGMTFGLRRQLEVRAGQRLQFKAETAEAEAPLFVNAPRLVFDDLRIELKSERPRTRATREQPSLLFITVDSLRSDRLSTYGYGRRTSPNIDELSRKGTLFESAFSTSSWTWPSTASILTGLAPDDHGLLSAADAPLAPAVETLAEALQAQGFSTAAISGSPHVSPKLLFDQGFESFDTATMTRKSEDLIASIETRLGQLARTRFFLYVHLTDPEAPRIPLAEINPGMPSEDEPSKAQEYEEEARTETEPDLLVVATQRLYAGEGRDQSGEPRTEHVLSPEEQEQLQMQYDASVAIADQYVGQILMHLVALNLQDTTVVVLTSDHGEELLERGYLDHGHGIYREQVQVPLILTGPGIAQGLRIETPVSNRHIAPTLARLFGTTLGTLADGLDLLEPGFESPGVVYQSSRGRWLDRQGLELVGLRHNDFVLQRLPMVPLLGTALNEETAFRLFAQQADPEEGTDLSPAPNYLDRARDMLEELEQRQNRWRTNRRARELRSQE